MQIGEKIQSLRKLASLSQEDLAEQIGVSRQTVSKWERDECLPEVDKIVAICQLFDVSIDELLLTNAQERQLLPLDELIYRNNQRKTVRAGITTGIVGVVLLVISLLLTDLWAFIDWKLTRSFQTNHMDYLKQMPLSFVFWLSILTIIISIIIIFTTYAKRKNSINT